MRVTRLDIGRLGKAEPFGSGGVRLPAFVGRTGVQVYRDSGVEVREYRPPEEVFAPESLASLEGVAITIGHPREAVTPANFKDLAKGLVLSTLAPEKLDGQPHIQARVALTTADAISAVDSGDLEELSCGYSCDSVDEPGVTPDGERYDRIQRNIRYNHVALGPNGFARAGRNARLKLDGNPMKIRFDGIEYDTSSEADMASLQMKITDREKSRADQDASFGAATTRADALERERDALRASIPSLVNEEIAFRDRVRPVLGAEFKFDGKSRREVSVETLAKIAPKVEIKADHSDDFVRGCLDAALASGGARFEDRRDSTPEASTSNAWTKHIARLDGLYGKPFSGKEIE